MKTRMNCEVHYHPVCLPFGMSFMPVTICEPRKARRIGARRKK